MNRVTLIGNLCKDVELRKTVNDTFVASTSIAVQRDRKNDKGEYETDFFDVKLFGNQADFAAKYTRKGSKVCIDGRIQIREYVNKDNIKCKAIEVLVNTIENLTPKAEDGSVTGPAPETPAPAVAEGSKNLDKVEVDDDDLPF